MMAGHDLWCPDHDDNRGASILRVRHAQVVRRSWDEPIDVIATPSEHRLELATLRNPGFAADAMIALCAAFRRATGERTRAYVLREGPGLRRRSHGHG